MPHTFVSDLHLGSLLTKDVFLLREKTLNSFGEGRTMLRLLVADRSGSIAVVAWDASPTLIGRLTLGQGVEVSGRVTDYRGQVQITADRLDRAEIQNPQDYLPATRRPLSELEQELGILLASIQQPALHRLLDQILGQPETYRRFTQAPAAKSLHHACLGGLLEHTLTVARLAEAGCQVYPEADRDLVMTATLLHDLGKIEAYDPLTFDMVEMGSLWGHLYLSAVLVEQALRNLPDFPPPLRLRLIHCILAHHGRLENGSPVMPMTVEALLLHNADRLDAEVRGALDHLERSQADDGLFTERSMMHETRLYRG